MSRCTRPISTFLLITLSALLGCGGNPQAPDLLSPASPDTFVLEVSEASFLNGASADTFQLEAINRGSETTLRIRVQDALRLTALYADVSYDPSRFTLLQAEPTQALGAPEDLLSICDTTVPGVVQLGQVLTHPQFRIGLTGSAVLAELRFRHSPAAAVRRVSAPPTSVLARSDAFLNPAGDTLFWGYYNPGDYDQNGVVSVQDLTPIGLNFLLTASDTPDGPLSVVDGNRDGLISIQDLTPIGANFGRRVTAYNVYSDTNEASVPPDNLSPSTIAPVATVEFALAEPNPVPGGRLRFHSSVQPNAAAFHWVRAVDEDEPDPNKREGAVSFVASGSPVDTSKWPTLSLSELTPAKGGDGAQPETAYNLEPGTTYQVQLVDPEDGNVTSSDLTTFVVERQTLTGTFGSSMNSGTLAIGADMQGTFSLRAVYHSENSRNTLHFLVGPAPALFIRPGPTDAWTESPSWGEENVGSSENPYLLHTSGYNTEPHISGDGTFSLSFAIQASQSVSPYWVPLPSSMLSWATFPVDAVTFNFDFPDASFRLGQAVNCEILAFQGPTESNHIFVSSSAD